MSKLPHWPIPYIPLPKAQCLDRMRYMLNNMGNPHNQIPNVIHVSGTNGKGSTIAFLEAILRKAGYKVNKYTSPHLVHYNERITLNGKNINDYDLHRFIEQARIASNNQDVTFFEGTTAAAIAAFAAPEFIADFTLIETGMGGRFDATNIIPSVLSIITPISYDHTEFLGETLKEIAWHKAGIIKPKSRCIISWQHSEALISILEECKMQQAGCYAFGHHWSLQNIPAQQIFVLKRDDEQIEFPYPNLKGPHQILNAATAIIALECLEAEIDILYSDVAYGIQNAIWPARLEKIQDHNITKLVPEKWEIWLDGAHNVSGAKMLNVMIQNDWSSEPVILINGRTKGRDIEGFLSEFKGLVCGVIAVPVLYEPKSEDPEKIANISKDLGFQTHTAKNVVEAIKMCYKMYQYDKARILVTGSLYLASDLKTLNNTES